MARGTDRTPRGACSAWAPPWWLGAWQAAGLDIGVLEGHAQQSALAYCPAGRSGTAGSRSAAALGSCWAAASASGSTALADGGAGGAACCMLVGSCASGARCCTSSDPGCAGWWSGPSTTTEMRGGRPAAGGARGGEAGERKAHHACVLAALQCFGVDIC